MSKKENFNINFFIMFKPLAVSSFLFERTIYIEVLGLKSTSFDTGVSSLYRELFAKTLRGRDSASVAKITMAC